MRNFNHQPVSAALHYANHRACFGGVNLVPLGRGKVQSKVHHALKLAEVFGYLPTFCRADEAQFAYIRPFCAFTLAGLGVAVRLYGAFAYQRVYTLTYFKSFALAFALLHAVYVLRRHHGAAFAVSAVI